MAGLKRTQRSGARTGATDTYYSDDDYGRDDYSRGGYSRDDRQGTAQARSSVRPRFGTGARPAPARRRTSDGLLQWRLLALGACVLILGTGGVIAMRAMAPVAAPQVASLAPATLAPASPPVSQPGPVLAAASAGAVPTAPSSGAPVSTTSRTATPVAPLAAAPLASAPLATAPAPAATPARPSAQSPSAQSPTTAQPPARVAAATPAAPPADPKAAAGHAQMATQVASILGTGAPAATTAAPVDPARAAPTAEDLARPAFLEPPESDEADLPEGAAEAAGDATPLPTPRPARAEADADARTVRIRSAVTLRSGPRRSASAIGTLDEGTRVTLYSCKSWCEVSSGDKRGFVYKSAVAQ